MKALGLMTSVAGFVFVAGTAQAEIIRYRCQFADNNEPGLVEIDTKSGVATSWTHPGRATVSNTTITVSQDEFPGFMQIDRKTGAARDETGNTARCTLTK